MSEKGRRAVTSSSLKPPDCSHWHRCNLAQNCQNGREIVKLITKNLGVGALYFWFSSSISRARLVSPSPPLSPPLRSLSLKCLMTFLANLPSEVRLHPGVAFYTATCLIWHVSFHVLVQCYKDWRIRMQPVSDDKLTIIHWLVLYSYTTVLRPVFSSAPST